MDFRRLLLRYLYLYTVGTLYAALVISVSRYTGLTDDGVTVCSETSGKTVHDLTTAYGNGEMCVTDATRGRVCVHGVGMCHQFYAGTSLIEYQKTGAQTCPRITFTESFVGDVCARIPGFEPVVKYLSELRKALEITEKTRSLIAKKMLEMKDLSEVEKIAEFLGILATLSETTDNLTAGSFTKDRSAKERIKEVEIYVKCNYGRHISTNEVARHVGMSESGFCAFWKRRTGEKFTSYLTSRRIAIARYLLKNKDLSISDVSYETGFADLPSFSKAFKRLEGISPKKYRKSSD